MVSSLHHVVIFLLGNLKGEGGVNYHTIVSEPKAGGTVTMSSPSRAVKGYPEEPSGSQL